MSTPEKQMQEDDLTLPNLEDRLTNLQQTLPKVDKALTKIANILDTTKNNIKRQLLLQKIAEQIDFYFSDKNLPSDVFLLKAMSNNEQRWVSLKTIATFTKIKNMCGNNKKKSKILLTNACALSNHVELDETKFNVRRIVPLTGFNIYTVLSRTIVIRKLLPSLNTCQAVRARICTKCSTTITNQDIETVVYVNGKEQPTDVLRMMVSIQSDAVSKCSCNYR